MFRFSLTNIIVYKFTKTELQNDDYEYIIFLSGGDKKEINSHNHSNKIVCNNNVYKLNVKSKEWENFTKLKADRVNHRSIIIGNHIYLVGGLGEVPLADTEIIPISKQVKKLNTTIPKMGKQRTQFGMCSFAGCIFVAGGFQNNHEVFDKCEVYSFESREWIEVSSMNAKRCSFSLTYFENKVWAIGGCSKPNGHDLDTIETYNLSENKWTTIGTKLLSKRKGHCAVAYNKKLFVVGGLTKEGKTLSSIEVYSSETKQFSFVKSMRRGRAVFGCCLVKSSLYVIGGVLDFKDNKFTNDIEIYDIENDVWKNGPSLPIKLVAFGCSSLY